MIEHLELSDNWDKLGEGEKMALIDELNAVQQESATALTELVKSKEEGRFVQTVPIQELMAKIAALKDKVSLVSLEEDLLKLIKSHNAKVDEFTRKFDSRDLDIIAELKKTDLFEDKLLSHLPSKFKQELKSGQESGQL